MGIPIQNLNILLPKFNERYKSMYFLTKDEAFAVRDDAVKIPIEKEGYDFRLNTNWFKRRNLVTWSTFFPKEFSSKKPVNMIQIGVWEGADLVWCLQNILGHPDSRVVAIDPWLEDRKRDQSKVDVIYEHALHNLHYWKKKIHIIKEKSQVALPELIEKGISIDGKPITKGDFDLIVIDGEHHAPAVYSDAMNSFELIRENGWMVFDDYHNRIRKKHHVQEGVTEFLFDHEQDVDLEWQNRFSLCLKKRMVRKKD